MKKAIILAVLLALPLAFAGCGAETAESKPLTCGCPSKETCESEAKKTSTGSCETEGESAGTCNAKPKEDAAPQK